MSQDLTQQSRPAVAIAYQSLELPGKVHNLEGYIEDLIRSVMTQGMGVEVEIQEDNDLAVLLVALAALQTVSPEVVLTGHDGHRTLIYDNQTKPVIRDEQIDDRYLNYTDFDYSDHKEGEISIDLEAIYNNSQATDEKQKIAEALLELRVQLKPANKLVLQGSRPKLLFLLALMCTYGVVDEVYYQASLESELIKVR